MKHLLDNPLELLKWGFKRCEPSYAHNEPLATEPDTKYIEYIKGFKLGTEMHIVITYSYDKKGEDWVLASVYSELVTSDKSSTFFPFQYVDQVVQLSGCLQKIEDLQNGG